MTGQMVAVDLREGEYIVCVYSTTSTGIWVLDGTPDRVPHDADVAELGSAIHGALDRSRSGLDELTPDSDPARPLLDLLGLPTFAVYAKGTRSVEVYRDGDAVEVTPRRNEGARRGFTPIDTEMTTLTPTSPEQLAAEVVKAFDKAV